MGVQFSPSDLISYGLPRYLDDLLVGIEQANRIDLNETIYREDATTVVCAVHCTPRLLFECNFVNHTCNQKKPAPCAINDTISPCVDFISTQITVAYVERDAIHAAWAYPRLLALSCLAKLQ